jgi:hypothetical protein
MLRLIRPVLFCFLVLMPVLMTAGQGSTSPLILLMGGDLWALDLDTYNFEQRTQWRYNQIPYVSPDARTVAYGSVASAVVEVIDREGGIGGGPLPNNIWVLDIASNDAYRAAEQPSNASFMVPNIPDVALVRSEPVWSPDGARLAWAEMLLPDLRVQLIIFEVGARRSEVVVDLPPPGPGIPTPPTLMWGQSGILVSQVVPDPANPVNAVFEYQLYTANGDLIGQTQAGLSFILFAVLATAPDGREVIAASVENGQWLMIDPLLGTTEPAPAPPQLYSPRAPTTSLTATPTLNPSGQTFTWTIADASGVFLGTSESSVFASPTTISPSPDGTQIAIQIDPVQIDVWNGQGLTQYAVPLGGDDIQALTWGPSAWRFAGG